MAHSSREKMIRSATLLFRERGLQGTSFRDVVEHSGAPRGSIYHHFPGGKAQLAEEAVSSSGEFVASVIATAARDGDPAAAVRVFIQGWRHTLESSDFRAGCPVVAVATEAGEDEPQLTAATAQAFASWQQALATALRNAGVRAAADLRNEKISYKIREHSLQKLPYQVVVGDKEVAAQQVAVRSRKGEDLGRMTVEAFVSLLKGEEARRGRAA
jgi:AcrR family transcriptional regulator